MVYQIRKKVIEETPGVNHKPVETPTQPGEVKEVDKSKE
jgi:hypothetical protein